MTGKRKLTPKPLDARESRFVEEYLVSLDPKQAALAAGYSKTMAYSKAYQWVSDGKVKPHVFAAVQDAKKARSYRTAVSADRVLTELSRLGFSDVRRLFTETGQLRNVADLDDATAAAIASVEVVTKRSEDGECSVEYVHKYKLWDKNSALDKLMKHLGEYAADKIEHSVTEGGLSKESVAKIRREILGIR